MARCPYRLTGKCPRLRNGKPADLPFKYGIVEFRSNQGRFASAGAIAKTESDRDFSDDRAGIHRREQVAEMSDWVD